MYLFQHAFALLDDPSDSSFTFHYVSISTIAGIEPAYQGPLFTFHYVSISTIMDFAQADQLVEIYIPLCIYFNCTNTTKIQAEYLFTFHYVSIST